MSEFLGELTEALRQAVTFLLRFFFLFSGAAGITWMILSALTPHDPLCGIPLQKHCYANMRVLLGAIEMYNMDNEVMITTFDFKDIEPRLLKGEYLKKKMLIHPKCRYRTMGDISTASGAITCDTHGTVE